MMNFLGIMNSALLVLLGKQAVGAVMGMLGCVCLTVRRDFEKHQ